MTTDTIEAAAETAITTLAPAARAVIALKSTETEAHLRALVTKAQGIAAVADRNGRDLAHSVGMELKRARTSIEKAGKAAREDATAFSKAVIAEEKRLSGIVESEEGRLLALRDEFDARAEAERRAKAAAEAARVQRHQQRIATIRETLAAAALEGSEGIAQLIAGVEAVDCSAEACEEFAEATTLAWAEVLDKLRTMRAAAVEREAEAARLQAEREELARQRAEQERRDAEAAAARAAEERAAAEKREAEAAAERKRLADERAAQEAELRRQREAQEAELARQRAELAEAQRIAAAVIAEQERQAAAARAEADRIAREAREAEEAKAAQERAEAERVAKEAREAEQRRIDAERAEQQRQEAEAAAARQREEEARRAQEAADAEAGQKLLAIVRAFIVKHGIHYPEVIHQTDWVIADAYEFIEDLCDVAGYLPVEE